MEDIRYIISDASKKIGVEQYTLRYWEDELDLEIKRNEMGHRYYREEDLEVFKTIKELKAKGYQLRAIRMLLPDIIKVCKGNGQGTDLIKEEFDKLQILPDFTSSNNIEMAEERDKLEQFSMMLENVVVKALDNNNEKVAHIIGDSVSNVLVKEMEYLLRVKEEREEERYKKFDRMLREIQSGRSEVSATREFHKKKKLFFSK